MDFKNNYNFRVILFGLITLLAACTFVHAEVYSAIAEMEQLLETEAVLITNLESYVEAQREKLIILTRFVFFLFLTCR